MRRDRGNAASGAATASRICVAAGVALGLATVVAAAWLAGYQFMFTLHAEEAQTALRARWVEQNATRPLQTAAIALATLSEGLARPAADGERRRLDAALAQSLVGLPLLREIALLGPDGLVLASSNEADVGLRVDLARLEAADPGAADIIGDPVAGRDLAAVSVAAPAPARAVGIGFLAPTHRLASAGAPPLRLVGLVNPELLATCQQAALEGEDGGSMATLAPFHARWWYTTRWMLLLAALALAFIGSMTRLSWRSLRARELGRLQLDAAQARIAHRERELSVLVKSVQEIIFQTDRDGRVGFVNARWHAVDPAGPDAARGRLLAELVSPSDAGAVRALFDVEAGLGVRTARVALGSDGSGARIFDIAVVPLRRAGAVVAFTGSAVDITEWQRAEQQLREQLTLSSLLLEISPLPVSLEDPQGRLLAVNQAWESFVGDTRSNALGRPASDFFPAPPAPLAPGPASPAPDRREAKVRHGDGSWRDMVVTRVVVAGELGTTAGTLSVAIDVSEYREAERATREARDAAEEASRAKSEFIANISHEMRTPLQAIMGFSELGMTRPGAARAAASMFEDIHAAGQRMLSVVNDLLDVSKIESTVGTFHLERVDLRGVARAVVREMQPLLADRRLSLRLDLADAPLLAKVDPMRIGQVLRNMVANAIRFSPPAATIALSGDLCDDGLVHFGVRDHGPGIPPGELESIFEAFVQSSRTKDGSGGTGLGLAICRKIVDAHGGRIAAGNAEGGGARFDVWLPCASPVETRPATLAEMFPQA